MKIIILTLAVIFSTSMFGQTWETNWNEALHKAQKENLKIILVFSGSDWCAPCIKLDKEIWSSTEFQELSKNEFVMFRADFPRKTKNLLDKNQQLENNNLAEKYNENGFFPSVVVLDSNEKILGRLGYEKTTPELYFEKLKSFEK